MKARWAFKAAALWGMACAFAFGDAQPVVTRVEVATSMEKVGQCDLGYVEPDSKYSVVFKVENASESPLTIEKVRSTCLCMKVPAPPAVLKAKSSTEVRVDFVAPKKPVRYCSPVYLHTTSRAQPLITLRVKADVGLPLQFAPQTLDAGTLIEGERRLCSVDVLNRGKTPVHPAYGSSTVPGCVLLVPRDPIPPGGKTTMTVEITSGDAPGAQKGKLSLHTDLQGQSQVDVEVHYSVSSVYRISKGLIDLGKLSPGESRSVVLELTSKENREGFIRKCEVAGMSNSKAETAVENENRKAVVRCAVTAGSDAGPIRGRVVILLEGHPNPVEVQVCGEVM